MVLSAGDRSRGTVLSTEPGTAALLVKGSRGIRGEQGRRREGLSAGDRFSAPQTNTHSPSHSLSG